MRLNGGMMDSGLVVVLCITSSLIILTFSFLLFVDYEWCHVLFKNNTVIFHFTVWCKYSMKKVRGV